MKKILFWLVPVSFPSFSYGDVTLPPLISDNLLLQQGKAAVWGKADPGEKVTVKLGKISATATAGEDGKWRVQLAELEPGVAGDMTVAGKNSLTVHNVAVGDAWVASGQSNMAFRLSKAQNAKEEIGAANYPEIRMFAVPRLSAEKPLDEVQGKWEVCTPQTAAVWSAVSYFFARKLHEDLKLPIGILHSSWGGTPAQLWTPIEAIEADPELKEAYYEPWQKDLAESPKAMKAYNAKLAAWKIKADEAKAAGQPVHKPPLEPIAPGTKRALSGLYNGMIHGAAPFTIKGAIWYQGESNTAQAPLYRKLLTTMIASWRKQWNQGDFPFLLVQLANYLPPSAEPADSLWANLRDAQRLTVESVPNTGLAVALDIGDPKNLHPKNKQEVGRRLALVAEAKVYGKPVVSSGPWFDRAKFADGKVIVSFKPGTDEGLSAKDGGEIKGFAVAGEDHKFVWAEARIAKAPEKKAGEPVLLVSAPSVPKPVALRYAWADSPDTNLVNKDGLPATSFRTDDWPQNTTKDRPDAAPQSEDAP